MEGSIDTGIGSQGAYGGSVQNTGEVSHTNSANGNSSSSSVDSISQSSQEMADVIARLIGAGIPVLSLPNINGNGANTTVQGLSEEQVHKLRLTQLAKSEEILSTMWDIFQKRIEVEAERSRIESIKHADLKAELIKSEILGSIDNSGPKSGSEYFTYIMSQSAGTRDRLIDSASPLSKEFRETFDRWVIDPANEKGSASALNAGYVDPLSYPSINFMAAAMITSVELFQGPNAGSQLSVSPISDALFATGPNSGLAGDAQAAAAMIAALLYGGAVNRANVETITESNNLGQPPRDLDFALNFAKGIVNILATSAQRIEPGDAGIDKQDKLIGLMLATIALNLLYRAAYHGMTSEELTGLLNGDTSDLDETVKESIERLVNLIKIYLPEDATEKAGVIAGLMEYVDAKHSVDSMLETTRQYKVYFADKGQVENNYELPDR